jgi:2-oxoglutarate dehydrogenase complex dehydrogenase (E1) component-like enzyme
MDDCDWIHLFFITLLKIAKAKRSLYVFIAGCDTENENAVRKVILVSGKHYYALDKYREAYGIQDVAIIRAESLCPFPVLELIQEIKKYKHATS